MNQLTLLVIVLVLFCYFGGKNCPSVLKKNKEILLGVAGGLVLCSIFGLRLEGFVAQNAAPVPHPTPPLTGSHPPFYGGKKAVDQGNTEVGKL